MDVRGCRNCKRLFNYIQGPPICPACRKALEEKFAEVKEFVRNNEGASMQEIADANEVSVKQLKQWVREERLVFSDKSPVGIECENCGKTIRTGRLCDKCKENMANSLQQLYAYEVPEEESLSSKKDKGKDRMRFLDK